MAGMRTEGPKARDAGATWQSERVPGKKCQKEKKTKKIIKKTYRLCRWGVGGGTQTWMRQWAQWPLEKKVKLNVKC